MRPTFAILIVVVLYTIAPLLSVLAASAAARMLGCELNEGSVNPCNCLGIDVGELLYVMGVLGWLALWTIPTGLIAIVATLAVIVASALRKRLG
jgi:hypothetical protein